VDYEKVPLNQAQLRANLLRLGRWLAKGAAARFAGVS
jgi:hypothetical protein